jgi:ribosome-associated protein
MQLNEKEILKEVLFKTSRSSGKGGQNVNKVSTKVELKFHILNSKAFSDEQKYMLNEKLKNSIDSEGFLHIVSQISRSQLENKKIAVAKLFKLLKKALAVKRARKPTKPTKAAVQNRIKDKKHTGEIKKLRSKIQFD